MTDKEFELSQYLKEWITVRYPDWNAFFRDISINRNNGIYKWNNGPQILDMMETIKGNIENYLLIEDDSNLIPSRFTSIEEFLRWIQWLDDYCKKNFSLIENAINNGEPSYYASEILRIISDISELRKRCWKIYQEGIELPTPFQQIISDLNQGQVDHFIEIVSSIIKGIPYLNHKEKVKESNFHECFHILFTILGGHPHSECATSDGRIDVVIETPSIIYIIELKYSKADEDLAGVAFQQIIDKEYAKPYYLYQKQIIGIGLSYSGKHRSINGSSFKTIYNPHVGKYLSK